MLGASVQSIVKSGDYGLCSPLQIVHSHDGRHVDPSLCFRRRGIG
jgi:hypothetical protein